MSYGRNPFYIYSDGDSLYLDGKYISENVINAFLYKVLLTNRRSELKQRLTEGKEQWLLHKTTFDTEGNLIEMPLDSHEVQMDKTWLEKEEDDLLKNLMI